MQFALAIRLVATALTLLPRSTYRRRVNLIKKKKRTGSMVEHAEGRQRETLVKLCNRVRTVNGRVIDIEDLPTHENGHRHCICM